ncbi:GASA domain-containing protein [Cephalotus follicularis]|uniref:GASA domain-containing protein n=1 Tax=Cephalotus follicularis TaxID=3775 RepID=A0A1Q3B6J2_CEPFO|nr:GASA domain-containing protein [Cephalotus follicularis]
MAISSTTLLPLLLVSLLIFHVAESYPKVMKSMVESSPPTKIDCDGACGVRCQLSSRPNLCKRACGTCCQRCDCVPPGTYGNYEMCPCYANMTTHGGRRKCP